MRHTLILLLTAALLAGCAHAGSPEHRRGHAGRYAGEGMGFAQASAPRRQTPRVASAAPDAILFAGFDRDGDLLISTAELNAGLAREFARADTDHDHVLSPAEYQAWSLRALGGAYPPYRLDVDRDANGQITFEEFSAEFGDRARRYDSNGDGVIEHADLVKAPPVEDVVLVNPQDNAGSAGSGPPSRP